MKFTKEFLQNLVWEEYDTDEVEIVVDGKICDNARWDITYQYIFKYQNKFYEFLYTKGATESQDYDMFEFSNSDIEWPEVVPVEKTVIAYETVENNA